MSRNVFLIILAKVIGGMPMPGTASSWGERSCPRSATVFNSVSLNWTHNLPVMRRTLYHWGIATLTKSSSPLPRSHVMMCSWGVTEEPTIRKKGLSKPWLFGVFSCKTFFIRFWEEGQCKPRTTATLMFANSQSNVISSFCSKDFWLRWWKWLCLSREV